jgi:predicted trehalose synthase
MSFLMADPETWTFPVHSLGADQAPHFAFGEPVQDTDENWLSRIRSRLTTAWCVVTDTEVLGPYVTEEEATSLLDEGMAGDVFQMRYR